MSYATLEHYQYGGPTPPDCEQSGNKNYGNCWSCEKNLLGKNYCLWHMPGDKRITGTVYSSEEDCLKNKCTDGEMPGTSPCGALNCYSYGTTLPRTGGGVIVGKCSLSETGTSSRKDCGWQSPNDPGTTVSWYCKGSKPHATFKYYDNEKDPFNSCKASCTDLCSPVCTGPNTPGGHATPGVLACLEPGRDKPLICAGGGKETCTVKIRKAIGECSVDPKYAICRIWNADDWDKDCKSMIARLQKSGDDDGNPYLAPGAECTSFILDAGQWTSGTTIKGVDGPRTTP